MSRNRTFFSLSAVALAVSAALCATPVMAQTSVTISGALDVDVNTQTSAATGQRVTSLQNGGYQTSYLQFSGVEDLGGGLKSEFKLGTFFQVPSGVDGRFPGDSLFSRDANVALSGDFGKVTMGRQISPLYLSTLLFNPFADSFNFSPIIQHTYNAFGAGNVIAADSGYSNAVAYSTPNMNGLSANFLYSLSGQHGMSNSFSSNVLYFNGPLAATFAYEDTTANSTNSFVGVYPAGSTQKVAQFGISYDFNPVKGFFQYENNNDAGAPSSLHTFQIGATVNAGRGDFMASYAKTGGFIDHKTFSLGYDYNMSKLTDVYTMYMNDQAAAYANTVNSFSVGIRHKF